MSPKIAGKFVALRFQKPRLRNTLSHSRHASSSNVNSERSVTRPARISVMFRRGDTVSRKVQLPRVSRIRENSAAIESPGINVKTERVK